MSEISDYFKSLPKGVPVYNPHFDHKLDPIGNPNRFSRDKPYSLKYPLSVGKPSSIGTGLNYNSNLSSEFAKTRASEGIDKEAVEPFVFFEFMEVIPRDKRKIMKESEKQHNMLVEQTGNPKKEMLGIGIGSAIKTGIEYHLIGNAGAENEGSNHHTDKVAPGTVLTKAVKQSQEAGWLKPALRQYKGSIAMYMPTDIQVNDTVQYNEQTRKTFGVMEGFAEGDIKADSATGYGFTVATIAAGSALGFVSKLVGKAVGSTLLADKGTTGGTFLGAAGVGVVMDEFQRSTGKASNPHDYMAYQSTGLRSFTYTFTFLPDSKDESLEVTEIIKQFRHAAHAERYDALKLTVPEHVIVSHHGAGNMIQLPPLVIESVNVSYNPNNSSFFMEGGHPVEVGMAITLKEIVPIYKHNVEGGM